jgi:hypothetical protein
MRRRDTRPHETTIYRVAVGCANLALAGMLVYATVRYFDFIVPHYGHRFAFFAFVMAGLACWMAFRGITTLIGRSCEVG